MTGWIPALTPEERTAWAEKEWDETLQRWFLIGSWSVDDAVTAYSTAICPSCGSHDDLYIHCPVGQDHTNIRGREEFWALSTEDKNQVIRVMEEAISDTIATASDAINEALSDYFRRETKG